MRQMTVLFFFYYENSFAAPRVFFILKQKLKRKHRLTGTLRMQSNKHQNFPQFSPFFSIKALLSQLELNFISSL